MIGYASVGTNDIERALGFYDAVLGTVGVKRVMQMPDARGWTMYGAGRGKPMLAVTKPHDGGQATAGNGSMVALAFDDRAQVDALHAKALAMGGTDEGGPGARGAATGPQVFYGAYFRDPDGNKFCAYTMGAA